MQTMNSDPGLAVGMYSTLNKNLCKVSAYFITIYTPKLLVKVTNN